MDDDDDNLFVPLINVSAGVDGRAVLTAADVRSFVKEGKSGHLTLLPNVLKQHRRNPPKWVVDRDGCLTVSGIQKRDEVDAVDDRRLVEAVNTHVCPKPSISCCARSSAHSGEVVGEVVPSSLFCVLGGRVEGNKKRVAAAVSSAQWHSRQTEAFLFQRAPARAAAPSTFPRA